MPALKKEHISYRKSQWPIGNITNLATWGISKQSFILLQGSCSEVSVQRHGTGPVSLVSRGGQQRVISEAGTAGLMTCVKVGVSNMWTQILPYHLGSQPVQRPEDASTRSFRSLLRRTAAEVWLHQAGALRNLSPMQSSTWRHAQQREVHRLGRGQGWDWD